MAIYRVLFNTISYMRQMSVLVFANVTVGVAVVMLMSGQNIGSHRRFNKCELSLRQYM